MGLLAASDSGQEQSEDECSDSTDDASTGVSAVAVDTQGIIFDELVWALRDHGTSDVGITDATVKTLLPHLLLPLAGEGGASRELAAVRLMRLITAMPEKGVARLAISFAGPLIRAYMGDGTSSERRGILHALDCLVLRAPTQMKVFVPQLQSTYFRGLSDADDIVSCQAAAAIHKLLPLIHRGDGLLASFTALLRSESAQQQRVLLSLRGTLAYLTSNATSMLDWSKSASLRARGIEMREALQGLSGLQEGEAGEAREAALSFLEFE